MTRTHTFRLALLAALALSVTAWASPASGHDAVAAHSVAPTQALVALDANHQAYAQPNTSSKHLGLVDAERPITYEQTVLPVLGTQGTWLHVRLPGRPNSHTGWIDSQDTTAQTTAWHLVVRIATRRVYVYRNAHVVRVFRAIVGKPSTPTPLGQFFIEESVRLQKSDPGAPFALALSARSNVYQEFDGGPGQVALHGLDNIGGDMGSAESHGCVRLADSDIRWLVYRVGPGVPVTIIN
jgi:lipoprotein-anchoring transpeptidase ErfK/SrfK